MSRDRRRTIRDGVITLAIFPLLYGVAGLNSLHTIALGVCVGWIAGNRIWAAIFEVIDWRDERRMAREYVTTGAGRPVGPEEIAAMIRFLDRDKEGDS